MAYKLLAQDEYGKTMLVSSDIGGANVVIPNVPCETSVFVGAVVRMSSGTAVNAIANSWTNANLIGVVESKVSSTVCNIRVTGVTEGTVYSGLDETEEYFLSASNAGYMTVTPPSVTGQVKIRVGQPYDAVSLLVAKGERTLRG